MRGSFLIVALLVSGSTAVAQPGPTPGPTPTPPPDEEPPPPPPDTTAEPETPPPPEPAPVEPAPAPVTAAPVSVEAPPPPAEEGYPLALALRPLALPRGLVELAASGQLVDAEFYPEDPIDALVSVRAGLGMVELEAGAQVHLRDPNDFDELGLVRAAARYVVHPNLTVGVEGVMYQPTMDNSQINITPGVGYKLRLSDAAAVETRAGVTYMRLSFGGDSESVVSLVASGKLQVSATPQLAAEFGTDLYVYVNTPDGFGYPFTQSMYSLRGLFAANKHLDIFTGVSVTGFQDIALKYVSLGVQGRVP